jgi:glycosyltransferase involved in cell wall biosynthesis
MKRIGIDARLYFQTGVGVYLRNFLHYLQDISFKDVEFYVYVLERDSGQIEFANKQFIKREVTTLWHTLDEQTSFYSVLQSDKLDLMHFTYFSYPVFYKRPFIATVHDITPLTHKTGRASTLSPWLYELKHAAFKYVLGQQVKNAKRIITPTDAVKKQLFEIYGLKYMDKITPVYEGVNYELMNAKENESLKKQFHKRFFLYVGNFYPHKNVGSLLEAYKSLKTDTELILVGPENYFSDTLKEEIAKEGITNIRFYHTGKVEDLVFFYKNALALINPSISEGFGLPLVEAAYFNLPIIASNLDVFKELFGEEYIYFDPKDVTSIAGKLEKFIEYSKSKSPKVNYSTLLKKYSFEKMTQTIAEIYKELL